MDDYLSKPIDTSLLIATVEGMDDPQTRAAEPARVDTTLTEHEPQVVFDEAAALHRAGDDRRLLKQLIGLYRADAPATMREIAKAMAARDAEALRVAAHTLKGSVATVGGASAKQAALTLENLGKAGSFDGADAALVALSTELSKLDQAFATARLVQRSRRAKAHRRPAARSKTPSRRRRS
jgi:HPt (histidine-containing phosphotransfer) domain-containing protein